MINFLIATISTTIISEKLVSMEVYYFLPAFVQFSYLISEKLVSMEVFPLS